MDLQFNALTDALTTVVTTIDGRYADVAKKTDVLLGSFVVIDIVLWGCWTMLGAESIANFAKKFLSMQIWLFIIRGFHGIAKWLMHTLVDAAGAAGGSGGGVSALLDPSSIAGRGLDATLPLAEKIDSLSNWDVGTKILLGLILCVIMFCFIIMAVNIAIAVIEYYVFLTIGGILIPFAFLAQTRFLADKGINAVLAATLKLTAYAFVLAIIKPILGGIEFHKDFGAKAGLNWNDIFAMLLVVGFCAGLCLKAPQLAAGLIHGSPSISGTGIVMGAAGAAMYGAAFVGAAAVSGLGSLMQKGGELLNGIGERIPAAGDSSMAAANRAGTMAGAPTASASAAQGTIFVVAFPQAGPQLGGPAPGALPADVIDAPADSLGSGAPRQLERGGSGEAA